MPDRVKYPLTPEAKEAAKKLVDDWNFQRVEQNFSLVDMTAMNDNSRTFSGTLGTNEDFSVPSFGIISELAKFGLLDIHRRISISKNSETLILEVTLLQELRNAVENDFEVSDFFLTTSAVGTIIYGNLTLDKGALFQSAAAGIGDVTITAQTLPDEIIKLLGIDADRPEIAGAIEELRQSNDLTRHQKAGKVIEELGRGLAHLSNTGGALTAIVMIARMLMGGGL